MRADSLVDSIDAIGFLKSVSTELVIFCITVVCAFIIRRVDSPPAKSKKQKISVGSSKSGGACSPTSTGPLPKTHAAAAVPTKEDPVHVAPPLGGERAVHEGYRSAIHADRRSLHQIIDEVVEGMRCEPGTRFAARALTLYTDLRAGLGEDGRRIADVARQSRHTPLDFYTTMVQCAIRAGRSHFVESIIDDMILQGVVRPLIFYESAMKQLAGQKHYQLALSMHDRIVADGLEPSAVTCSCLISFAAELGELERACTFFKKLSVLAVPSIRAYMTMLRVHAKRQDWEASIAVFRDMQARGVKLDSLVLNVILATGVATDKLEGVEALLAEADGLQPPISDVVSYNTLVKGYAQRNDAAGAERALVRMRQRQLKPNAITFNTAIDASVRGLKIAEAWSILQDMRDSRLQPDKYTCSILVKGLTKSGAATVERVNDALNLLQEVGSSCDHTLRTALYHSVMDGAAQVGDLGVLLKAFMRMREHQVTPSGAAYRLLAQALALESDRGCFKQAWRQLLPQDASAVVREASRLRVNLPLD